ncbi:myotubularin-related protein [Cavenderia fasciculata]|uniref:Myotubularin-related protein n=1 Tax=Cavenderia fasciculata TaxID=261658 RepID=F4Q763_CACFS|nr:myotubularin-related protein [Cavenderia fasciculata]EGG16245.1 myotubularin-related protein [Cavenderia fasciculata]|eukprot:XP_004354629.1 myotubularin-related protein [Cavenderia fasciculata]
MTSRLPHPPPIQLQTSNSLSNLLPSSPRGGGASSSGSSNNGSSQSPSGYNTISSSSSSPYNVNVINTSPRGGGNNNSSINNNNSTKPVLAASNTSTSSTTSNMSLNTSINNATTNSAEEKLDKLKDITTKTIDQIILKISEMKREKNFLQSFKDIMKISENLVEIERILEPINQTPFGSSNGNGVGNTSNSGSASIASSPSSSSTSLATTNNINNNNNNNNSNEPNGSGGADTAAELIKLVHSKSNLTKRGSRERSTNSIDSLHGILQQSLDHIKGKVLVMKKQLVFETSVQVAIKYGEIIRNIRNQLNSFRTLSLPENVVLCDGEKIYLKSECRYHIYDSSSSSTTSSSSSSSSGNNSRENSLGHSPQSTTTSTSTSTMKKSTNGVSGNNNSKDGANDLNEQQQQEEYINGTIYITNYQAIFIGLFQNQCFRKSFSMHSIAKMSKSGKKKGVGESSYRLNFLLKDARSLSFSFDKRATTLKDVRGCIENVLEPSLGATRVAQLWPQVCAAVRTGQRQGGRRARTHLYPVPRSCLPDTRAVPLQERIQTHSYGKTISLWLEIDQNLADHINPLYAIAVANGNDFGLSASTASAASSSANNNNDKEVLIPDCSLKRFRIWRQVYANQISDLDYYEPDEKLIRCAFERQIDDRASAIKLQRPLVPYRSHTASISMRRPSNISQQNLPIFSSQQNGSLNKKPLEDLDNNLIIDNVKDDKKKIPLPSTPSLSSLINKDKETSPTKQQQQQQQSPDISQPQSQSSSSSSATNSPSKSSPSKPIVNRLNKEMGKKKTNKLVVTMDQQEEDQNTTTTATSSTTKVDQVNNDNNGGGDSDGNDDDKVESKGKMIQRHKAEQKELQKKIQQLNREGGKKDKKAKDELAKKITTLEEELNNKQAQELKAYEKKEKESEIDLNQLILNQQTKGPSKAYLKKAKRQADEEERMRQLEEEKKKYVSKSITEFEDFAKKLRPLSKSIKHIKSDGDCLYNSLSNQLLINGKITEFDSYTYSRKLRQMAADYITANAEEFKPFIMGEEDFSDSEDPVTEYCQLSVLKTGEWGGHIELRALSSALKARIVIYHAYAPDVIIGEEFSEDSSFYLSYHMHAFTLGAHYNSVIPSTI